MKFDLMLCYKADEQSIKKPTLTGLGDEGSVMKGFQGLL